MSVKAVLFDLDGTLLPMEQEIFIKAYFKGLAAKMAPLGYNSEMLMKGVWMGTESMIQNDGSATNEEVFWKAFTDIFGEQVRKDEPHFEAFYRTDFQKVKEVCGFASQAADVVHALQKAKTRVALATNPLFPSIATESRIRWAGLLPSDFELYTTYENSRFCKPNLAYYKAITDRLGVTAEECLMVGNDVSEDMVTKELGMKVFLLTDCLINKNDTDISVYPNGGFDELTNYLSGLNLI